ncbi:unnamed protein product, partial [marine sediment metagenome]
ISTSQLLDVLKKGDAVEFEKITVGTRHLIQLLRLLPGEYCQISANGRLEIETVELISRKGKDGIFKAGYTKPKHYHNWLALQDGAWLKPHMRMNLVVIKPRKF